MSKSGIHTYSTVISLDHINKGHLLLLTNGSSNHRESLTVALNICSGTFPDHTVNLILVFVGENTQLLKQLYLDRFCWNGLYGKIPTKEEPIRLSDLPCHVIICTYWLSGRAGRENIWLKVRTSWPRAKYFPVLSDLTQSISILSYDHLLLKISKILVEPK